jgi:hypothetical protein
MATPKKLDREEVHHCYYCEGIIGSVNDIAWKKFPIRGKNNREIWKNRKLHVECLLKYNEEVNNPELKREENSEWDKLYQYVRGEVLGLNPNVKLDQHLIKRLLGLRLGQYYPSGNNTRILPRGYDFSTILIAFKLTKPKIQAYLNTGNFKDGDHRVNGMMKFVIGEIDDIARRLDAQKKSNEKLRNDEVKPLFDYTQGLKRKEGKKKIRNGLDD